MNETLQYLDPCEESLDSYSSPSMQLSWEDILQKEANETQGVLLKGLGYNVPRYTSEFSEGDDPLSVYLPNISGKTLISPYIALKIQPQYERQLRRALTQRIFELSFVTHRRVVINLIGRAESTSSFSPDFFSIRAQIHRIIERKKLPVTISTETKTELQKLNLIDEIEKAIALAENSFSKLHGIEVTIEDDPEIIKRRTIRIELTVSGPPEEVLKDESRFKQGLYANLPLEVCERLTTTYKWKN